MLSAQAGGNTHLGAWLLLAPLASAAASHNLPVKPSLLKERVRRVLTSMDWMDTMWIFRSVARVSPRGLGRIPFMDVMDDETYREIREKRLTPIKALKPFREREVVAREWVTGYRGTFYGAQRLVKNLRTMEAWRGFAQTFLELLAKYPDTHIGRRGGRPLALRVSMMASRVLELGGMRTKKGVKALMELDKRLRRSEKTRPGATADLFSASIAVVLLSGWRP